MAESRIRNAEWQHDDTLKQDLEQYVCRNLRRQEILDFVSSDYPMYAWNLRSLGRRLQFFDLKYTDYGGEVSDVQGVARSLYAFGLPSNATEGA